MKKLTVIFLLSIVIAAVFYANVLTNFQIFNKKFSVAPIVKNKSYTIKIPVQKNLNTKIKLNSEIKANKLKKICGKIWRYSFICALEYALNNTNLENIKTFAIKLKGQSLCESVWNVLKWEGKNIKYNWSKARLPATVVEYWGNRVKIIKKGIWYQTPAETIQKRSGICGDYAILTSALLLNLNITPYPAIVNFTSGSHATVLTKIDGWYFVLDQHLPPMDLGAYYREWKYYRNSTFGSRTIKDIHIYEVIPGRRAKVIDLGLISSSSMLKEDYRITDNDTKALCYALMEKFRNVGLVSDPNLRNLKPGSSLPEGYVSGRYWTFSFPHYADYYNPVFYKEYVNLFFSRIYSGLKDDAESCNRVWVSCSINDTNLVFHILLARYS